MIVFAHGAGGADAWTIEWEDLEHGDADFNDLVMAVERVAEPEPAPPTTTR